MSDTKMNVLNSENPAWCTFIRRNARNSTKKILIADLNIAREGYANHIPHGKAHFGTSINRTMIHREGQCSSTEYAPTISRPDPPILVQPDEIYHKHVGMIPNYLGHVPGVAFRYGKTFEVDTRDAKKWLWINSLL